MHNLKNNTPEKDNDLLEIFSRIRQSDTEAFKTLFKMFYKPLITYAMRYVRSQPVAEDIVHDIFLKIWEQRREIQINTNFKSYLYKMTHNQALNYLKSKRLEISDIFDLKISVQEKLLTEEIVYVEDLKNHIEQAIKELPERTRDVFTMHRFDHLKYSEIAEILNIKQGTVETHMVRALKYLRKRLSFILSSVIFLGNL